jgi:hypothetical protein
MAFLNRDLSDDLLPFSGKLSERFYEVRENVASFCEGVFLSRLFSLARRDDLPVSPSHPRVISCWRERFLQASFPHAVRWCGSA